MFEEETPALPPEEAEAIGQVLGRIPQCGYIMTARTDDRIGAVLVSWVQQACIEPPMVSVAIHKSRSITPLILDSHVFCLCQIDATDKTFTRRFSRQGDDFSYDGLEIKRGRTSAPIITDAQSYLECEVMRHVDFDVDHDLYVAMVIAGGVLRGGDVATYFRDNGQENG